MKQTATEVLDADAVDLSVCAIMKNEAPYVKEWLDYHLLVGVKRFYIYDNESEDNLKEVLTPYILNGVVIYKFQPGQAQQQIAYDECLQQYRRKTKWLAFIDADEFIVPIKKRTISEFLMDYEKYAAVVINWIQYDSDGLLKRPIGGVLENYTRVYYHDNQPRNMHIKSICQPFLTLNYQHPHFGIYKDGYFAVTENLERVDGAFTGTVSVSKIRINHYYSKSVEEYTEKINRGRADRKQNIKKVFYKPECQFLNYKYDYAIWRYVAAMQGRYFEQLCKRMFCGLKNIPIHIVNFIEKKEFTVNDFIDEKYYKKCYPDYVNEMRSAKNHYMLIGWRKGYNPSAKFDTAFYCKENPSVVKADYNPLWHYIQYAQYGEKKLIYRERFGVRKEYSIDELKGKKFSLFKLLRYKIASLVTFGKYREYYLQKYYIQKAIKDNKQMNQS